MKKEKETKKIEQNVLEKIDALEKSCKDLEKLKSRQIELELNMIREGRITLEKKASNKIGTKEAQDMITKSYEKCIERYDRISLDISKKLGEVKVKRKELKEAIEEM